MSFFDRLLGVRSDNKWPENRRLSFLINNWSKNKSDKNYQFILEELLYGNSYLLLPDCKVDPQQLDSEEWHISKGQTLKLMSIYNLDGIKVIGVFTDEKSLFNWARQATHYTALKSQNMFELCDNNNIKRIVVNSGSLDMFVIHRANN